MTPLIFLQEWKSSSWLINSFEETIKENKDHGEVGSEYNSMCSEKLQLRMKIEIKLLKLSLGEKIPRMYQENETAVCIRNTESLWWLCDLHALCRRITLILAALQEDWEEFTVLSEEMRQQDLLLRSVGSPCCFPTGKLRAVTNCWNSNATFWWDSCYIYSVLFLSHYICGDYLMALLKRHLTFTAK